MLSICTLKNFLAVIFALATVRASPVDLSHALLPRDNNYGLNCSNAPGKVAGELVSQSDVIFNTNLPESGSNQQWMKYLYCTPETKTYTFFNFGRITEPTKRGTTPVLTAFEAATQETYRYLQFRADSPIGGGKYNISKPAGTNVEIYAENREGTLTWGILHAAMAGMERAMLNYNKGNYPLLFQINDGEWGEVGWGYAGYINDIGWCIFDEYMAEPNLRDGQNCRSAMGDYVEGFQ